MLNGFSADYSTIESGVPQGSVLGPLWNLMWHLFADDIMLFSVVNDPVISADELNHDLKVLNQWAYQWKMEFNPNPQKQATELIFSCKKNSRDHLSLFFNGTIGFFLDSKLSFGRHTNENIIKPKKKVLESLNIFPNTFLLTPLIKCIRLFSLRI